MTEPAQASNEKIYMLNALWFEPDGGAEKYVEYLKAAGPIVKKYGGRKLDSYQPDKALIGSFNPDLLFFVEWPSWDTFQEFVNDPEYQKIMHLREEAIINSLLIRCNKV